MTINTPCPKCGQQVSMLKQKGFGLAVPMESLDLGAPYWTTDQYDYIQNGGAFIEHECNVDLAEMYRSATHRLEVRIDRLNDEALSSTCPRCEAEPGEMCWNLLELRKNGKRIHTKTMHPHRYPVAEGTKP